MVPPVQRMQSTRHTSTSITSHRQSSLASLGRGAIPNAHPGSSLASRSLFAERRVGVWHPLDGGQSQTPGQADVPYLKSISLASLGRGAIPNLVNNSLCRPTLIRSLASLGRGAIPNSPTLPFDYFVVVWHPLDGGQSQTRLRDMITHSRVYRPLDGAIKQTNIIFSI